MTTWNEKTPAQPAFNNTRGVLAVLLTLALLMPLLTVRGVAADECMAIDASEHSVCGAFATFWQQNDGIYGRPLTGEYVELSADTGVDVAVQYFELGRLEYHPGNEGSAYAVIPGRVGAEVMEYVNGVTWRSLPGADAGADWFFTETGHAVAPEFQEFFRSNGLDLGDEGTSLRESLGLFGYPISEPRSESNFGGDEVLTQWFERARLELHGNDVEMAYLGIEMTSTINGFSPRILRELDANLHHWQRALNDTGLMAGIWVPGVGEWTGIAGAANRATGAPLQYDQHVRIGSISKSFTTTMILQLADQGLLSIDDTIDTWVDDVPNGDRITLRDLATMTSGLASFTFDPDFQEQLFSGEQVGWTPVDIVAIGIENTLAGCPYLPETCFEPGEAWFYNNTNTVLLGMVLEAVTGREYGDLVQEMILDPLGMENTFHPTSSDLPEPFAHGYTTQGLPDDSDDVVDATNWDVSWTWAVGSLVSTFEDLTIWARAVGSGELLSAEMHAERLVQVELPPNTPEHAYAFGIGNNFGWWGHGGSIPGYNTSAYYRPDLDAVLTVVANSDQARFEGGFIDPAHTFAAIMIDIANREAPLGGFAGDTHIGGPVDSDDQD